MFGNWLPTVETVGYGRPSLRDFVSAALVGEVISTVALADRISREFNASDQSIDKHIIRLPTPD